MESNDSKCLINSSCMHSESFARGDLTWTTFFLLLFCCLWGEGGIKYHYKQAIIGPPAKRHLNGVSLRADNDPTLNAGLWLYAYLIEMQASLLTFCIQQIRTGIYLDKGWKVTCLYSLTLIIYVPNRSVSQSAKNAFSPGLLISTSFPPSSLQAAWKNPLSINGSYLLLMFI